MRTLNQIRDSFIQYFVGLGHTSVHSSSLVPKNDPTLMFTNAGMVPFKDVFTGLETRSYRRAVSAQKCVRAGGKHNDLENVGYTARHHTFFEMLGNFSFGDYGKAEAIEYAWKFVTQTLDISPKKLLVTTYTEDTQAAELWKKIAGFSDDRIIRIATQDNFWSMGDTGPCGPCTEIFYDHGDHIPGGPPGSVDEDSDRYIEIWNLVFMQYNQQAQGQRTELPNLSIDTGMGIERLAAILQGVHDNYDTDLFRAIIDDICAQLALGGRDAQMHRQSLNVIADHLRSTSFLLADGILPSNEGRGYVLRRIMRRAMRHAHLLGASEPLMHRLVPVLVHLMGTAYPELARAQAMITDNLLLEETRFQKTLSRGLKLLEMEARSLAPAEPLPGSVAFRLYDTYGFPLDLTQDVLRGEGRSVDVEAFDAEMAAQKAQARAHWVGSGEAQQDAVWYDIQKEVGVTAFLGYDTLSSDSIVQALVTEAGQRVMQAQGQGKVGVVLDQSPFYAESGGQEGDQGVLRSKEDTSVCYAVLDCQVYVGGLYVHWVQLQPGQVLTVGTVLEAEADATRRDQIRANHSATHLLHAALRLHLGAHVTQKGSLVAPDRLRFDFTHTQGLDAATLEKVERDVNAQIIANTPVVTRILPIQEALDLGAMALFGEKYDGNVRVLSMGAIGEPEQHQDYSIELCGGTHVKRTGDIGFFKIISEVGISSGVRRIEALTGLPAYQYCRGHEVCIQELSQRLKCQSTDLVNKVSALQTQLRTLEKQFTQTRQKLALLETNHGTQTQQESTITAQGYTIVRRHLQDVPAKDLKPMVDQLKQSIGSGIVLLSAREGSKVSIVIGVTPDLTTRIHAADLVRQVMQAAGGRGGGGRADMAQAGGEIPQETLLQAFDALEEGLKTSL